MSNICGPRSVQKHPRVNGYAVVVVTRLVIALWLAAPADGFNPQPVMAHSRRGAAWAGSRDRRKIRERSSPVTTRLKQHGPGAAALGRKRSRLASADAPTPEPRVNGHEIHDGWMRNPWDAQGGVTRDFDKKEATAVSDIPAKGIMATTGESMEAAAKQSVPLKVMVFVDGTWLYYSFFGRGERCHVSAKLGPGWNYDYRVKWEMLPVIISRALHAQLAKYNQSSRLVEVVRTVVFSSARSDTDKDSTRMQMFESMREKKFEVHMATTVGVQEKCIDIALAVEMMHYATIPDTYDVGVLVTGDKDFMPAMSRTRQKGRRVCLCSMRNSCNMDLLRDDAHVMDFPPVWINEYLDDIMEYAPSSGALGNRVQARVPPEVICEIITDLMRKDGGTIRSRDLGRALNRIRVLEDGTTALGVIKESCGSLTRFLAENDMFLLGNPKADPNDSNIKQFMISLVDRQNSMKSVKLGEVMDESTSMGSAASDDTGYDGSEDLDGDEDGAAWESRGEGLAETAESLSKEKIPQLKARLREKGMPVSGNKAALVERLLASAESDGSTTRYRPRLTTLPDGSDVGEPRGGASEGWEVSRVGIAGTPLVGLSVSSPGTPAEPAGVCREREVEDMQRRVNGHAALVRMVGEVLDAAQTEDGVVSSRDVGRELARMPSPDSPNQNALVCLKSRWPSLMAFLRACPSEFTIADIGEDREFGVFRAGRPAGGHRPLTASAANGDGGRHNSSPST